jgi:hypothetical protein
MADKIETRARLAPRRAPEYVCSAADSSENTTLVAIQATRLLRRFKVSDAVALTIAELAFENGRSMR